MRARVVRCNLCADVSKSFWVAGLTHVSRKHSPNPFVVPRFIGAGQRNLLIDRMNAVTTNGLGECLPLARIIHEYRSTGFQPVFGEDRQDACPTTVPVIRVGNCSNRGIPRHGAEFRGLPLRPGGNDRGDVSHKRFTDGALRQFPPVLASLARSLLLRGAIRSTQFTIQVWPG